MTDWSQNGEQPIIIEALKDADGKLPIGRFLDLGAYDGMKDSNTRALSDLSWEGVCVEANPRTFKRLLENHWDNGSIICVCGAIVAHRKQPSSLALPRFYDTGSPVSTCELIGESAWFVQKTYHVASFTPEDLALCLGYNFDFINIDIEGMDLPVIRELAPLVRHTRVICFEDSIPCLAHSEGYYQELLRILADLGFPHVVGRTQSPTGDPANTIVSRTPKRLTVEPQQITNPT